jgi:glycosyltransferase involved in cell wall biosynthesis
MQRFSVIVPLYNKAPYVKKALESICAQTYKDFECIIVDDGSTDNSLAVVKEFVERFKILDFRFKILNQENAGVAVARNNGVAKSNGEYVCFLDADDWWEANYLEEMNRLIREYPEAGLYGCDYYYVKNGEKKIFPKNVERYIDYCKVYTQCGVMPIHPNGAIIPRKVFDEIGGFDPSIKMGEDFILFMQIVLKYKVAFLNKQLVTFNQDADPTWRAITKLHKPEHHMLWHVSQWESQEKTNASYKAMIDMLRVKSLLPYWLSKEYHEAAADELKKVDWSKQPKAIVRQYKMPIALLKAKKSFLQIGSYIKQKIKKIL